MVKTLNINGRTMRYISFGKGERSFIVIPGLAVKYVTDNEASLERAFGDFADDFTVYVFDRVDNPPEGYKINDMADDTISAMDMLNIKNACIFGASQGGMIGMTVAIKCPELIDKLVLGSTTARENEGSKNALKEWISLGEKEDRAGLAKSMIDLIYSENTIKKFRSILEAGLSEISNDEFHRFIRLGQACNGYDIYDKLEKITADVFVMGCEGDRVVFPEASREIADKLNCKLYMYSDEYGHGVYDEAPDYRSRILEFIK